MGMLTGKYAPDHPPQGMRRRMFRRERLAAIQPLIEVLRKTGTAHGGMTPAQVALNWLLCKGVVPIPGAKNGRQAADNAAALGWRLSGEEVNALDEASRAVAHL
jgi:aryl-alcohol dehydrogenase-like predicted oxidoreductase